MKDSRYLGLIPNLLSGEHAPLKVQIPGKQDPCCDSWMGHAINPLADKLMTPIGTLYYMFWAQRFSEAHDSNHCALVVDDPLLHDGVSAQNIGEKSKHKKEMLERIVDSYMLDRIEVVSWDIFKDGNTFNKDYNEIWTELINILNGNDGFKEELIAKTVPLQYRQNPRSYLYVVDEIVAVLYMTSIGNQYRLGHLTERKLDRRIKKLFELGMVRPSPGVIYLQGDHALDADDRKRVLPPSKEHKVKRRILLSDDYDTVHDKIDVSSKFYRGWLKKTLDLGGFNSFVSKEGLVDAVYDNLISPLR